MKPSAVITLGILLISTGICPAQERGQPPRRPNILWIVAENIDHDLGCYGARQVKTPNIDRLAREGVRFTRVFSTAPVCAPSRSAFMTGMYQTTTDTHHMRSHRTDNFRLPPGVRPLTHWLQDAGYSTFNIGRILRWLVGTVKLDLNFVNEGPIFQSAQWADLKKKQPFFAMINTPEVEYDIYDRKTARRPRVEWVGEKEHPQIARPDEVTPPPYFPDHPVARAEWARYLNSVSGLDVRVGKILDALKVDGLEDDTIVIFFADNGRLDVRGIHWCYDSGLRVPLIIRWPRNFPAPARCSAGTVNDQVISLLDLTATTMALAGLKRPPGMQSRLFLGPDADPPRRYAFSARDRIDETVNRIRSVRNERYRYNRNFMPQQSLSALNRYREKCFLVMPLARQLHAQGQLRGPALALVAPRLPEEELFDTKTDPFEINNLAGSKAPEHREALLRLRTALEVWLTETGDRGRFPEPPEVVAPFAKEMHDWFGTPAWYRGPAPVPKDNKQDDLPCGAADLEVRDIRAVHRHGQTFITWKDVAEGAAGARVRYSLYRSSRPITADNWKQAELCYHGVLNNSARLFGTAFNLKDRLDATKRYSISAEGGQPLPPWSGLAVHTVRQDGTAFYAVVATDEKFTPLTRIVPGQSATTEGIKEKMAPIQPIKLFDSRSRGIYSPQTSITGQKGLPLRVELHASQGQGGGAGEYGDYYLYFATPSMGYRDGLPGVFSVEERREKTGNYLLLRGRDAIEHPSGTRALETFWFGYYCTPQHATHAEPRAYPFTERRQEWIIDWVVQRYAADPERLTVSGGSMGAWGSTTYGLRHPERFAAVYPNRPRTRQRGLPSLVSTPTRPKSVLMDDGKTDYFTRMDMVKFAAEHPGDLPFFGWCCGRRDGFASWQEQVDMVRALTAARHGFAFAWNNGDHSSGAQPMARIMKYFPPEKFARNRSYPAFSNSSLDQNLGSGDPKDGDLEGGINLGFTWSDVVDEPARWGVTVSNDLAQGDMSVDITPRCCQRFKPRTGDQFRWTTSSGGTGTVTAAQHGLVTVPRVVIQAGKSTVLTIRRNEQ